MYANRFSLTDMVRWGGIVPTMFLDMLLASVPAQAEGLYMGLSYEN